MWICLTKATLQEGNSSKCPRLHSNYGEYFKYNHDTSSIINSYRSNLPQKRDTPHYEWLLLYSLFRKVTKCRSSYTLHQVFYFCVNRCPVENSKSKKCRSGNLDTFLFQNSQTIKSPLQNKILQTIPVDALSDGVSAGCEVVALPMWLVEGIERCIRVAHDRST